MGYVSFFLLNEVVNMRQKDMQELNKYNLPLDPIALKLYKHKATMEGKHLLSSGQEYEQTCEALKLFNKNVGSSQDEQQIVLSMEQFTEKLSDKLELKKILEEAIGESKEKLKVQESIKQDHNTLKAIALIAAIGIGYFSYTNPEVTVAVIFMLMLSAVNSTYSMIDNTLSQTCTHDFSM